MSKRLRAKVKSAASSNTNIKAVVIDTAPGRATVRLATNGAVLTMLNVSGGGNVSIGSTVIVDFTGSMPLVRTFF